MGRLGLPTLSITMKSRLEELAVRVTDKYLSRRTTVGIDPITIIALITAALKLLAALVERCGGVEGYRKRGMFRRAWDWLTDRDGRQARKKVKLAAHQQGVVLSSEECYNIADDIIVVADESEDSLLVGALAECNYSRG